MVENVMQVILAALALPVGAITVLVVRKIRKRATAINLGEGMVMLKLDEIPNEKTDEWATHGRND